MQRPLTAAPSVRLFNGLRRGAKRPRRHGQPQARFSARHGRPRQRELMTIQLVPLDGVTQPVGWGDLIVGVSG